MVERDEHGNAKTLLAAAPLLIRLALDRLSCTVALKPN